MPRPGEFSTTDAIHSVYIVDAGDGAPMVESYLSKYLDFTEREAAGIVENPPAKVLGPVGMREADEVASELRKLGASVNIGSKYSNLPGMERISEKRETVSKLGNTNYFFSMFQSEKDHSDTFAKLDVEGELRIEDADAFKTTMADIYVKGNRSFILDLTSLEYISDVAVGLIAEMNATIQERGGQLTILAPEKGQVRDALEALNMI